MSNVWWIKPVVSLVGLGIFVLAFVVAWLTKDDTSLKLLTGGAISIGTGVINYWLGSSSSSDKKTDLLAMAPALVLEPSGKKDNQLGGS